ncbi:hypothetical protein EDB89DRAFT_440752 [Lactarius sanguifluus]|nr:hypothetical protein EDB89DRAFT_440752 [Lactarius sanguifluus]
MLRCDSEESGKGLYRPAGAVERLTDDVLLEIFGFYRDALKGFPDRPWRWHTLVHVCRSWRRIVFASSRRLDLQLLCTVGTPVRKYLGCWPETLPIVINYRSQWNSLSSSAEDEDNIFAALDHPSRVCSIELVAASSFINEIFGLVQRWFPALTNLRLSSPDPGVLVPIMSRNFLRGHPRLQKISICGVSFPALPNLLLSFRDLVELQLLEILSSGYVSPEAVVAGLSGLSRLRTLEIGYSSLRSCTNITGTHPPPPILSTLSTLTEFRFKGSCEYLEDLVARLDTPSLQECCISFFREVVFNVPQLTQFICRTEALRSPDKVLIVSSETVSLRFWQGRSTGSPIVGSFSLNFPYFHLNWQFSCVSQICFHSSPLLSGVKRLSIDSPPKEPDWLDDVEAAGWTSIFASFVAVEELYVSEPLGQHVAQALALPRTTGQAEILPALRSVVYEGPQEFASIPEILKPLPPPAGIPIAP